MKNLKLLLAGISFLGICLLPAAASADVNNFTITNFTADETLSRADPQGELHVVERINVDFTDSNHGLLRAIPKTYKGHALQLRVNGIASDTGAPTKFTTYDSNGNTVLKIGDPNNTVTGAQEYTIDYTLRNVISFMNDHDELYWDVNGDQWQQPFNAVTATVHLPTGLSQTRQPVCYSGGYGVTLQNGCVVTSSGNLIQASTTRRLFMGQTLTYVAGFQKGYFTPSTWYESLGEHAKTLISLLAPIIILGGGSLLYWLYAGRDPKGSGVIIPQYQAPDGLTPLEVGTLADFRVDNKDITATIIDLAVRGYIKIIETKQDRLIGKDKLTYELELAKADFSALNPDEQLILTKLFPSAQIGKKVQLTSAASQEKLYKAVAKLRKDVKNRLTDNGYFRRGRFFVSMSSGEILKQGLAIIFNFSILIGAAYLLLTYGGTAIFIGLILGLLIAVPFIVALNARTAKGVAAKEAALGLKMYLDIAEKDRIQKLQAPNAPYAVNASEPVKTVELFEKLLPFAIVLGVEKQWGKQFEALYTTPPDWYSGNWTTFNAYYLASSIGGSMGSAVNSAFSPPSSSSSSGFGGGGFSGGGGGGGGGGGW